MEEEQGQFFMNCHYYSKQLSSIFLQLLPTTLVFFLNTTILSHGTNQPLPSHG